MQAALKSITGVSEVIVGKKVGSTAETTISADRSVKVADLITALEQKGFSAKQ